jgi:hypothetical protein
MAISLNNDQVLRLRMRAQLLTHEPEESYGVAKIVQNVGGLQAQDSDAMALAVGVRGEELTTDDVAHALAEERTVVRTWGVRGTLHLLATKDLGWLLPLIGPVFQAASSRRLLELDLDDNTLTRGVAALRELLQGRGPMTKSEILYALQQRDIEPEGQAFIHLIRHAALGGVLCLGPDRGSKATYVLLSDWAKLGKPLSIEKAYMTLTRRYLEAYAPTTPEDMGAWSGLPMVEIRKAWQTLKSVLLEVEVNGSPAWMLHSQATWLDEVREPDLEAEPVVRLLPAFDIFLLGYKKRDLILPPAYIKQVNAGGGMLKPVLLVNGRVVGTWKSYRKGDGLEVSVKMFEELEEDVHAALDEAGQKSGQFLQKEITVGIRTHDA